ncbi:GDCCVxC domain-containing (seleno)protein [Antarctobacter heliothermus]|uniref:GDCCVxC domain-containing (seleno)protein n=1 Tax=Antarctobacter heliothermus TaxID=74033 RepID=UPI000B8C03A9|nr:GDCCVxC domain-containing (seleno)protein [Antarctobacter heliothermus]
MTDPVLISVLTCPACNARSEEQMPTDACQFFWECPSCKTVVRPKPGDCCVYCSYGTVPCPPIQDGKGCCA